MALAVGLLYEMFHLWGIQLLLKDNTMGIHRSQIGAMDLAAPNDLCLTLREVYDLDPDSEAGWKTKGEEEHGPSFGNIPCRATIFLPGGVGIIDHALHREVHLKAWMPSLD